MTDQCNVIDLNTKYARVGRADRSRHEDAENTSEFRLAERTGKGEQGRGRGVGGDVNIWRVDLATMAYR